MSGFSRIPLSDLIVNGRVKRVETAKSELWNLNLDQIEPDSGRILERVIVRAEELGPSTYPFDAGTVLYSKLRPYLNKVVVADEDGFATTELVPLRCDPDRVLPSYLAYFLRSPEFLSFANTVVAGAKMPRMVMSEFWRYEAPIPSLTEQRRIAAILEKADALRTKRREAMAQCDRLAQFSFLEMFGDPVNNPKGWQVQSISGLPIHIADGNYSSKYPSSSEFVDEGVPFIRANNLSDLTINSEDMRFITADKHEELAKGHLREGDVLICTRGEIGKVGIVPAEFENANINAQLVLLRPKDKTILSDYLCHLLNSATMNRYVRSFETGVALKQLPIHALKRILIPIPPTDLQIFFSKRVQAIEKSKSLHSDALTNSEHLFASLQHRAFRGEL